MAAEILCPDCGGVIGATEVNDGIGWPCTCGTGGSSQPGGRSPDDTDVDMPAFTDEAAGRAGAGGASAGTATAKRTEGPPKPCITCGRDTNGHRRFKDHRGYMCYACAKAEQVQARAGSFKCEACGRWMPDQVKHAHLGKTICATCLGQEREAERKRPKKVDTSAHAAHERRNLYILLAIMAVLLTIVILRQVGVLGT